MGWLLGLDPVTYSCSTGRGSDPPVGFKDLLAELLGHLIKVRGESLGTVYYPL